MNNDIIYQQHYAKKVEAYTQQVAHSAFTQGRQQGWNDILFILNEYQDKNIEATPELVVESLKQLLAGNYNTEADITEDKTTEKQQNKKSNLSVIK